MGLIYNAAASGGLLPLMAVRPGDFVSVRGTGNPSGRDAQGRMPHLLYKPGGINQQCLTPTHWDIPLAPMLPAPPAEEPIYRDNGGAVYFPLAGQVSIAGGSGEWNFSVVLRRGNACEQVRDYRYKITSYSAAGTRISGIVPPHGAEYVEIFDTAELVFSHGTTNTSFPAAAPGRYYLEEVFQISFQPVRDGQMTIHGRM